MNTTIFQFFHWYFSSDNNLWNHVADKAQELSDLGVTHVWLPPAYKSAFGATEAGYAVYDLFDLGEFDQKETIRTKYGTKQEYMDCIKALHDKKMDVLADIVLNHKIGADEKEIVPVQEVKDDDRNDKVSQKIDVEADTRFTFPGRKGKYSQYIWDWHSFTGFCADDKIHLIHNEYGNGEWEDVMEDENGNYDYLMGCDIEFRNHAVREELKYWGKWYVETTGVDGFRLDAVKHINTDFFPEWLGYLKQTFKKDFFCIGEYWKSDIEPLLRYIEATGEMIQLFDVPLHFNFHKASKQGSDFDLRQIFDATLVKSKPHLAITFVDNHDTQPLQSLESWVEEWFKPHAYAIVLLREQGIPCVFYTALYGASYSDNKNGQEFEINITPTNALGILMKVRTGMAYGTQRDYFDSPNIIGWTREGIDEIPNSGCAVVLSNADAGELQMSLGEKHAAKTIVCVTGQQQYQVVLNEKGEGVFSVDPGSISVWVFKDFNEY